MGTDVHAVAQIKKKGAHPWQTVPLEGWNQNRHYFLFAWIGNVRNGFGFAGIPTGEPITPLSDCRGLPPNFEIHGDTHPCSWDAVKERFRRTHRYFDANGGHLVEPEEIKPGDPDEFWITKEEWLKEAEEYDNPPGYWMGDHSHSWLNAQEILDPSKRPAGGKDNIGVVDVNVYKEWKRTRATNPTTWAGDVSGGGVNKVVEPKGGYPLDAEGTPIVPDDVTHIACVWHDNDDGLQYFVDAVQELVDKYPDHDVRLVFGFDS